MGAMAALALEQQYQERKPIVPQMTDIPKRTYQKQDNGDILAFFSYVQATPDFAYRSEWAKGGYRQVFVRTKSGKFRKIVHFHQSSTEVSERLGSVRFAESHDYYITKNSFSTPNHTKEALFSYDNIVIDLDIHDNNKSLKWYDDNLDFLIDKLIYLLTEEYKGKFPAFNVVRSGRGVQLWIGLESFSARVEAFRRRYTAVCDYFCHFIDEVLEDNDLTMFEVDYGASTDATRLARIPYTYNQHRYNERTHKGYQARFDHLTDYRYDLDEIQDFILSPTKKPRKAKITQNGDFTALNVKRMRFIEGIVKHTEGDCEGRREVMAWLYYNALIQTTEQETAEEMLYQLNKSFKTALDEAQIRAILAEFERKRKNIGKIGKDGYPETGYYTIGSAKFLDTIQATTNERLQYIGATSRELDRKAARAKKADRDRRIAELTEQGMSYKDIAEEVGCSARTVSRKDTTKQSKADRDRRIIELRADGLSVRDIASEVGCSKNTVTAVLAKQKETTTENAQQATQTATESVQDAPQTTERNPYPNPHPERIWGQPETYTPKEWSATQKERFVKSCESPKLYGKPKSSA